MNGRFWLMDWLIDQGWFRDMPRGLILTLLSFARHANTKGISYPAVPTTAEETGQSDRSVQRWTRKLVKMGLLFRVSEPSGGNPRNTTRYRLFAQTYLDLKKVRRGDITLSPVPAVEKPLKTPGISNLRGDSQPGVGVTKQAPGGDSPLSPKGTIKELEGIAKAVGKDINDGQQKTAHQQIAELHENRHLFEAIGVVV